MRYVILPNHEPRDRVSLRLLVLSGSLEEKDDQRGLPHYLAPELAYQVKVSPVPAASGKAAPASKD